VDQPVPGGFAPSPVGRELRICGAGSVLAISAPPPEGWPNEHATDVVAFAFGAAFTDAVGYDMETVGSMHTVVTWKVVVERELLTTAPFQAWVLGPVKSPGRDETILTAGSFESTRIPPPVTKRPEPSQSRAAKVVAPTPAEAGLDGVVSNEVPAGRFATRAQAANTVM
jgi:hypothetical protein